MVEEREAGGFYDETGIALSAPVNDLEEQFRTARDTKQTLITQAVVDGDITQEYAHLLHAIKSSTTSGDLANLEKVEAALSLRNELEDTFQDGKVAYIGSGNDWRFAVALGARKIDMVDEIFADEAWRDSLLADIQSLDPQARLDSGETSTIQFGVNLGKGIEPIDLQLCGVDVTKYNPQESLAGVIEFAGPTKSFVSDNPLLPNVRRQLSVGAKVVNFDYMKHPSGELHGFKQKSISKFTVLNAA